MRDARDILNLFYLVIYRALIKGFCILWNKILSYKYYRLFMERSKYKASSFLKTRSPRR